MTDKQINHEQSSVIIDGIDVSRCTCRYYAYNRHLCSLIGDDLCEEHSDCLYKQLKRKEKSEEKLVKQIQTICDFINNRPETFKGINGSVDKIITDYAKAKEQECEDFKQKLLDKTYAYSVMERSRRNSLQQLDQLEEENRSLKKQLQFEFDETLLQYSNTIEDLQKQLKDSVMQKCPQCGETYLNPVGCELHEENQQLKAENKTQKETIDGFLTILDKLGKSNIKLREILAEIKEIAMGIMDDDLEESSAYCDANRILQKISEVIDE